MTLARRAAVLLLALGSVACGSGSATTEPPESLTGCAALDVAYGPHERNVLDFWQAQATGPRPVAVFIHGGGFVSGSKANLDRATRDQLLQSGVSVASISYRYITTDPMPAPMLDGARAIQFLRSRAGAWRIDTARVAAWGGSAGGAMSMWLGLHADMADPRSADPVARQSTRLTCLAPNAGQSSLDPEWIKANFPGGNTHLHPNLFLAFGVTSYEQLDEPAVRQVIEEVSAINHATSDDPPTYMTYSQANAPLSPDASPAEGIHHPIFGIKLKEALDPLGVEAVLVIQGKPQGIDPYGSATVFLERKLGVR